MDEQEITLKDIKETIDDINAKVSFFKIIKESEDDILSSSFIF